MGGKVGEIVASVVGTIIGFTAAFVYCYEFTLLAIGFMPVFMISGVIYGALSKKGLAEGMKKYAQSAGYAEQALYAIKVVHTYGREQKENENYVKYLGRALVSEMASKRSVAFAASQFMFVYFAFYGWCFYFGGYSRWTELTTSSGKVIDSGTVITCLFLLIISSMGGA
jgi:ABC-type bacteriocin/lantibiotic exporter with double-glycine peptidase domain